MHYDHSRVKTGGSKGELAMTWCWTASPKLRSWTLQPPPPPPSPLPLPSLPFPFSSDIAPMQTRRMRNGRLARRRDRHSREEKAAYDDRDDAPAPPHSPISRTTIFLAKREPAPGNLRNDCGTASRTITGTRFILYQNSKQDAKLFDESSSTRYEQRSIRGL